VASLLEADRKIISPFNDSSASISALAENNSQRILPPMSTLLEIESAIERLPPNEKWNLIHRLHDALWQDWDKQIEADAAAGRLDYLVQEVEADLAAGRVKPLDEIIDQP
jgi:hypothetical protein